MKRILFVFLTLAVGFTLFAQPKSFKFGKPSEDELTMKFYEPDSTVDAAVLCDVGKADLTSFSFTITKRFKIFSKEGLNYLIFDIPVETKSEFRGFVINMVDGEIVKEKISNEHVYITRSEGSSSIRIAPPNAHEGSIIDMAFTYSGVPFSWQFQNIIPVLYSELYIPQDPNFKFRFQQVGFIPINTIDYGHYLATDMPPFIPEKYINSEYNYRTGILIDLTTIHIANNSGMYYKQLAETWKDVNDYFEESDSYYLVLKNPHLYLNDEVNRIRAISSDPEERLMEAVRTIHQKIDWNEDADQYPDQNLKEVWDKGTGTSADMNFILMIMLRKLDIFVNPMLISARSRGRVNPFFPTRNKFNYTVCYVRIGEKEMVVDASDKHCPPELLTWRAINEGGFVINEDDGKWVNYSADKYDDEKYQANLVLDSEGNLKGMIAIQYNDYAARSFKRYYEQFAGQDEYLEDFESDYEGMYIEDYSNDYEENSYGSVKEKIEAEFDGYGKVFGDRISFNPVVLNRWEENPFKLEKREYPVDFGTPQSEMCVFTISLPEGYEVEQLPKSVSVVTTDKSAQFQYMAQQVGNNIQLMIKYKITKPTFLQDQYDELKAFFNVMVEKEQENIILKKKI